MRLLSHAFSSSAPLGCLVFSKCYSAFRFGLSVVLGKVYPLGLQKVCTCFSLFCPSWFWLAFREEQEFEENPLLFPSPLSLFFKHLEEHTHLLTHLILYTCPVNIYLYHHLQKLIPVEWEIPGEHVTLS